MLTTVNVRESPEGDVAAVVVLMSTTVDFRESPKEEPQSSNSKVARSLRVG